MPKIIRIEWCSNSTIVFDAETKEVLHRLPPNTSETAIREMFKELF